MKKSHRYQDSRKKKIQQNERKLERRKTPPPPPTPLPVMYTVGRPRRDERVGVSAEARRNTGASDSDDEDSERATPFLSSIELLNKEETKSVKYESPRSSLNASTHLSQQLKPYRSVLVAAIRLNLLFISGTLKTCCFLKRCVAVHRWRVGATTPSYWWPPETSLAVAWSTNKRGMGGGGGDKKKKKTIFFLKKK